MNICVIVPEEGGYSETFIRAHIERLPGKVTYLYGGYFPTRLANGNFLLPPPNFLKRVLRSLLSRLFRLNYSEEKSRHKALYQFLKNNAIDAVLAEYGPTATKVMGVCKEAGVALIVHFHGFDAYEHKTLQEFGESYKKMFEIAGAVVAVSKHMAQKLVTLGAPISKVHYVPCGMNPELFHGSNPSQMPPVFLTTGRFVDKKAPHLTILSFQKVLAQVPQAKLIMVGNGPLQDSALMLVKALKIEKSVEFTGARSHQEVAQLMREVRAFVQHSVVAHSGDSEGTPVAVMEAGGSGLPVIATRHAGIPDVIEDGITGFLVDECDIGAMADRMIKIAQDPQLASRMGEAAQKKIREGFTLDHSIKQLAAAISTAVTKRKQL
jgi:glycosyltransferase involved in cell wall biosynthesis